jgi:putative NIF3 family GTP cyclohydrolase 1 type 2
MNKKVTKSNLEDRIFTMHTELDLHDNYLSVAVLHEKGLMPQLQIINIGRRYPV